MKSIVVDYWLSYLFDNLYHILIVELVVFSNFLGVEFDRGTPDHSIPKISNHIPVYFITKVLNSTLNTLNDDRLLVIWIFSLGFGVNSNQIKILPHSFNEFI